VVLAAVFVIGGVEQNNRPAPEDEMDAQISCTGCGRNLKQAIQCELCERWYNYSCRKVKDPVAEGKERNCDKCGSERIRRLQDELQNAQQLLDEARHRNRKLEEKLQLVGALKRDAKAKQKDARLQLVGALKRNAKTKQKDAKLQLPGALKRDAKTKQKDAKLQLAGGLKRNAKAIQKDAKLQLMGALKRDAKAKQKDDKLELAGALKRSARAIPSYACLGRKEQLSLCSLKEYPLGTRRLLASGEPIFKFGFDLGFVKIIFRPRFVVGWRGQGCPRSQAVGGTNGCDTRTYFCCMYNFVISLWPLS
jgi:hypothetical protein